MSTLETVVGMLENVRSAAVMVENCTGRLKLTMISLGAEPSAAAAVGTVEVTLNCAIAFSAPTAFTNPKPPWTFHVPAVAPLTGWALAISAALIWGWVRPGFFCSIKAATAATLGVADDVPKKLGRFCERFVGVLGWPGNGAWLVSMTWPKNDVLPPSAPETTGLWTSMAAGFAEPSGLNTLMRGPNELKGSLLSGSVFR